MLKVGLTGGIGCGKTFILEALAEFGCFVIQADRLGREVISKGGPAYHEVVQEFGEGILDADGRIDRRALAALVFQDPERLDRLNQIVHPRVMQREEELLAEYAQREPNGIAVYEAAILIETGNHVRFDRLILAICTEEQQVERATSRGVTLEDVRARITNQMPADEKRKFADFVIDTSGEKSDTLRQTRAVYEALRRIES